MKFIFKSKVPSFSSFKDMSWHDHFDKVQHHMAEAEKAKEAGNHDLAAHHKKLSDVHHEMRVSKQTKSSLRASAPYAKMNSAGYRKGEISEAASRQKKAKELLSSMKPQKKKKSKFIYKASLAKDGPYTTMQLLLSGKDKSISGGKIQDGASPEGGQSETENKPKKRNVL